MMIPQEMLPLFAFAGGGMLLLILCAVGDAYFQHRNRKSSK